MTLQNHHQEDHRDGDHQEEEEDRQEEEEDRQEEEEDRQEEEDHQEEEEDCQGEHPWLQAELGNQLCQTQTSGRMAPLWLPSMEIELWLTTSSMN